MAGVASGSSKTEGRGFILESIEVHTSLPALWDVKYKEYSNMQGKKDTYAILLDKYLDRYLEANREDVTKKFNSLHTNFRKKMKKKKVTRVQKMFLFLFRFLTEKKKQRPHKQHWYHFSWQNYNYFFHNLDDCFIEPSEKAFNIIVQ